MTKRSHDSSSIDFPVYSRFLLAVSGYAALYNRFRPFHKATLNSLHSPQQRANKHSNPLLSDGCYGCCRQLDATLNDVDYTLMIFFCVGQSKNRYNVIDVLQFRVVQSATSVATVATVAKQRAAAFVCPLLRRVQTIQQRAMTCGHRRKCLRSVAQLRGGRVLKHPPSLSWGPSCNSSRSDDFFVRVGGGGRGYVRLLPIDACRGLSSLKLRKKIKKSL